jgi:hypothetical protein
MNGRSEPTFDKPVIRPRDRFFTKGNTSPVIKRDLFDQNIFFGQANNQKRVSFLFHSAFCHQLRLSVAIVHEQDA